MAEFAFAVEEERRGSLVLVRLRGELDYFTAPRLKAALLARLASGARSLVLDLSGVTFLDSSGLQVVLLAKKRLQEQGGTLAILGTSPYVERFLQRRGLWEILEFVSAEELPDA